MGRKESNQTNKIKHSNSIILNNLLTITIVSISILTFIVNVCKCCLLINFANSLDQIRHDKTWCLICKNSADDKKACKITQHAKILCNVLCPFIFASVTYPLDLTKTRLQIQGETCMVHGTSVTHAKRGMLKILYGIGKYL